LALAFPQQTSRALWEPSARKAPNAFRSFLPTRRSPVR
jgi:hypothetical protein